MFVHVVVPNRSISVAPAASDNSILVCSVTIIRSVKVEEH